MHPFMHHAWLWISLIMLSIACNDTPGITEHDPDDDPAPPDTVEAAPITAITLTPTPAMLTSFGEVVILTASATDVTGKEVEDIPFTWDTSDPGILTVTPQPQPAAKAQIEAIANGTATITVQTDTITRIHTITVDQQIGSILVTPTDPAVAFAGDTLHLSGLAADALGNPMPEHTVQWTSLDPAVATVDVTGIATAQAFGTATFVASTPAFSEEVSFGVIGDHFFFNGADRLRFDLDLPDGSGGPFPAMVFVHGSGRADRNTQRIATDPLVPEGMAVLRYDKRGVGESSGNYFTVGPANSVNNLGILASDAIAAIQHLKHFPEIDTTRMGLMANSQGGWISPIAAAQSDDITYMVIWSGPTVSVGMEIFYSALADGTFTPLDDVYPQLSSFTGLHGHDPMPTLETLTIPSIWLFGDEDRSIPTRLDTLNMHQLQAMGLPYEYILYPFAGHDLRDNRTGQFVDLWSDVAAWLREKGKL